jgi:hypothetical protein
LNPDDPLPKLRAELDQTIALAPEIARVAFGFYAAFLTEGFNASQALYLTVGQLHQNPGTAP